MSDEDEYRLPEHWPDPDPGLVEESLKGLREEAIKLSTADFSLKEMVSKGYHSDGLKEVRRSSAVHFARGFFRNCWAGWVSGSRGHWSYGRRRGETLGSRKTKDKAFSALYERITQENLAKAHALAIYLRDFGKQVVEIERLSESLSPPALRRLVDRLRARLQKHDEQRRRSRSGPA